MHHAPRGHTVGYSCSGCILHNFRGGNIRVGFNVQCDSPKARHPGQREESPFLVHHVTVLQSPGTGYSCSLLFFKLKLPKCPSRLLPFSFSLQRKIAWETLQISRWFSLLQEMLWTACLRRIGWNPEENRTKFQESLLSVLENTCLPEL